MRLHNLNYLPTQVASAFINIESYTKDTHLIVSKADGDSMFIGRAYEMSPLTGGGSEFSGLIQNILKLAPDDSLVQVSLMSVPDYNAPYLLVKGKKHGNKTLTELIHRQAKLYEKALDVEGLSGMPSINNKTVIVTLMIPTKQINDAEMESILHVQTEFLSGLKACGFYDAHPLSPGELIGVYRQYANIYEPRQVVQVDELLDLRQQTYGPDNIFDFRGRDFATLNNTVYLAAVVPKALPPVVSTGLMNLVIGAPLNLGPTKEGGGQRVKTPFIINASVRVASQRKEMDRVNRAIKSRDRYDKLPFELGVENKAEVLTDLEYIKQVCADGTNKYTYVSFTTFLYSKNKNDLAAAKTTFKTTLDNLDFDAREVTDTIGIRFAQALPLNFSPNIAAKLQNEALMPASAAACLLPIYGDYQGNSRMDTNKTGSVFLTRRGSAYYFDPFTTNGNKNGVLAAKSGAGKSMVMQYLVMNSMAEETKVFIFDNGKSVKKYCAAVGGEFIEFDLENPNKPSLNPFFGLNELEFAEQAETISALILKMAYFNEPYDSGARIAVNEAVKAAHGSRRGKANIDTVIDSLMSMIEATAQTTSPNEVILAARNLIPRLKSFMDSPSRGPFFQGSSSFDPENMLTVFELSSLDGDDHLKQCILFFVMNTLMTRIKRMPGRKQIFLDEAWQLLQDESAAAVMEGLYRKARKDDGSIWVITQSPRDLAGNPTGDVILSQSTWKLVMEQEPEEIDKIVANGVMTKFQNDAFFNKLIKDVKTNKGVFSEILICGELNYEVVRLFVDRFTSVLLSTEPEERDPLFKLMEQGIDPIEAVNIVIRDSKYKRTKWLKEIISDLRGFEKLTDAEIRLEINEVLNG